MWSVYLWRNVVHVGCEVRGLKPLAGASERALRGDEVPEAEQDPGDKFADILNPPHRDLIAQAHNGFGKTTCFVLGMLSRVDPKVQAPQALCVCPTQALANQNIEVLFKMGKYTGIASECAVPTDSNALSIAKRAPSMAQVVIGTPGTIKKWMSFKKLGAARLKILVFDEADQMLAEDGFKEDFPEDNGRNRKSQF
ncbi:hypothetical protein VIGAN_11076300 [Vigna angularis var. angularis]|uniref:Helicase ATP-binding domain-containing protein n=1 Tax=Vigna angularis var. angularis TaxID=157739 RepID=A0A0S3T8E2_PHAAN|nr:hypothetical protein VIGAN_11076300 [Vigna angularis var. angularis]